MAHVSAALMETALAIASELDAVAPGKWAPVRVALLASALYEALKRERAKADSIEAAFVLDGAIERCWRTADRPERMRDEIRQVILFLLDRPHWSASETVRFTSVPRLRLVPGGLAAQARAASLASQALRTPPARSKPGAPHFARRLPSVLSGQGCDDQGELWFSKIRSGRIRR